MNLTLDAVEKPEPSMVTDVPTGPSLGLKELTCGLGVVESKTKAFVLEAVALTVATLIGPDSAFDGTVALIVVSEITVKENVETPLKATLLVWINPVPLIVTFVPAVPDAGVKYATSRGLLPFPLFTCVGALKPPAHATKTVQRIRISKRSTAL